MMMITKGLFLILLSLFFLVDKSFSAQSDVLNSIYSSINLPTLSDYCASPNQCSSDGSITKLNITAPSADTEILLSQISSLASLNTLYLNNVKVNILVFSTSSTLTNLYLVNCFIINFFNSFAPSIKLLFIDQVINAYSFTTTTDVFSAIEDVTITGKNVQITYNVGTDPSPATKNLAISTTTSPNLASFTLKNLDVSISDSGNFVFQTMGDFENLVISTNSTAFAFPTLSSLYNKNVKTVTTKCLFSAPTIPIDLSGFTSLTSISFLNVGPLFSYSGSFPFSKLPPNADVFLSGGTFKSPPLFSNFNNIERSTTLTGNSFSSGLLDIDSTPTNVGVISYSSNTELSGTVPNTYCSLDISKFRFNNNQLNGKLPDCFYCYSGDSNVSRAFDGNSFDANTVVCKDIIKPTIEIVNNQYLRLKGDNLGFSGRGIISDSIQWTMKTPGALFESTPFASGLKKIGVTFSIPNLKFTFAIDSTILPIITNFNRIGNQGTDFSITGEFFSNVVTNSTVTINDKTCLITSSSFDTILCSTIGALDYSDSHATLKVTIDNSKTTTVFVSLLSGASNGNVCSACNVNGGTCNLSSAKCECRGNFGSSDCSRCVTNWQGPDCTKVAYSFSSISSPKEIGGSVVVGGWFGPTPVKTDFSITIGGSNCPIDSIVSETINCTVGGGTGKKDVSITYPGGTNTALLFSYISTEKQCPSTCIHGTCDKTKGTCSCDQGYQGLDCGSKSPTPSTTTTTSATTTSGNSNNGGGSVPGSNTNVDPNTGGTSINNQQTNYEIYLTSVLELDLNGEVVQNHTLKNNWQLVNSTQEGRVIFQQSLSNDNSGSGGNITFIIDEISIDKYPNGKEYSFAGVDFLVTGGSLKMQFAITDYVYQSSLNSLQVTMESTVGELEVSNEKECKENQKATSIEAVESGGNLNYLKISKDSKIFYGRFIDRALSDNRPTFINSFVKSKSDKTVIVGINLPHCLKECLIDPDFSVLVAPEFVSSCSSNKRANWVIPVAVVVPVVAISIIVVATILILKKNRMSIKLKLNKLKSVSMKSFKN